MSVGSDFSCGNNERTELALRDCGWVCMNFHIREFPQVRVHHSGGPLPDKKFSVALDDERNETARRGGGALAEIRQFPDAVFAKRDAEFFYRANPALRIARRANQCAKFHEGLVEVSTNGSRRGRPYRRPLGVAPARLPRPTSSSANCQSRAFVFFSRGFSRCQTAVSARG